MYKKITILLRQKQIVEMRKKRNLSPQRNGK